MFQIAETETFSREISNLDLDKRYEKAKKTLYAVLRENPYYGNNIKKLKGEFVGLYRYRLGDYRLIYSIDEPRRLVFLLHIVHRKNAY